jgi:LysM repeat protein
MTMTASLERSASQPLARTHQTSAPSGVQSSSSSSPSINIWLAVATAAAIVAAFVGLGGDAAANGPLQPASDQSAIVDTIEIYVVQPGDTLWSIATGVSVEGEDVRPIVDHLKSVAGGSALDVGQRIVIDHAAIRS